jgi:membrane glycosyltransferase
MISVAAPSVMIVRRAVFVTANLVSYALLLAALSRGLPSTTLSVVLICCFAIFAPWSVLGFWSALVGTVLLFGRQPDRAEDTTPVRLRTAMLMTIRNEDPARAINRFRIIQRSLDATGAGDRFGFFVLSDTSEAEIAGREAAAVDAWRAEMVGPARLQYRRRTENTGFKAGNVMAFCERWGDEYDLMLPLDADSLMSGDAILQLVRIMQANPGFGIVQGLVVGLPARSLFARAFQFGMRHGMRSYTVGQAWWTGDCGPFWGHNAIIRLAPFRAHCALPVLSGPPPFGGHVLSHDQVEATLMRRAGYDVRLQVVAGGSWEENPPTVLDYIRRDLRWCQGNLQYLRLLGLPGLRPVSRFQLVWAILMFIGIPAWTLLAALLPAAGWMFRDITASQQAWLEAVYWLYLLMYLSPKLAGYAHTAASKHRRRRYGGLPPFLLGALLELVFSLLQSSVTALHVAGFMVSLPLGRSARWSGQARDVRTVSWRDAWIAFWPQTVFGVLLHGALMVTAPALLPWALPFTLGYLVAVPFAVVTADPRVGVWCERHGLFAVPEEIAPPPEVSEVSKEAVLF